MAPPHVVGHCRDDSGSFLPSSGVVSSLGVAWACLEDPATKEVLMLAEDGIYRIAVEVA